MTVATDSAIEAASLGAQLEAAWQSCRGGGGPVWRTWRRRAARFSIEVQRIEAITGSSPV